MFLRLCLATSDSCQTKSASVLFLLTQCELCQFCPNQLEDEQLMLSSAVCLVPVASVTSGACCRCSFLCCQLILCTRLCVHDSHRAAHNGSRKPYMSISSHRNSVILTCTVLPGSGLKAIHSLIIVLHITSKSWTSSFCKVILTVLLVARKYS